MITFYKLEWTSDRDGYVMTAMFGDETIARERYDLLVDAMKHFKFPNAFVTLTSYEEDMNTSCITYKETIHHYDQ